MSNSTDKSFESEQSFEELLGRTPPRPVPSDEDVRIVRGAVHAEWQAVTRKHVRQRRLFSLAAAATVLLALAIVINVVQVPSQQAIQVAEIDRSVGSIYVLGDESQLLAIDGGTAITTDQTIVTANDSGLGLAWAAGGSLRIAENSRITFTSPESISLQSGMIYFDSKGMPDTSTLRITTEHGTVTHVGTQYMVGVEDQAIEISVREGRVSIDGLHHATSAEKGERVTLTGSLLPTVLSITPYSDDWRWVEATASIDSFDGNTVLELIEWVARETGMTFDYVGTSIARDVNETEIYGVVLSDEPRIALEQGLLIADLEHRVENGVIYIFESGAG